MGQSLSNPITTLGIERQGSSQVRAAAVSMQGWRLDMEDEHNIELSLGVNNDIFLFGVYDGHGGCRASRYICQTLPSLLRGLKLTSLHGKDAQGKDVQERLRHLLVYKLDADFIALGAEDGSTCCFVLTQAWNPETDSPAFGTDCTNVVYKCLAVNIGDSRASILRKDGTWVSLTKDHKPNDDEERRRIIAAGGTVQNGRVDGNLALSRAIGDSTFKRNFRLTAEKQKVISVADFTEHDIYPDDVLLVACDGLYESNEMTWEAVAMHAIEDINRWRNSGESWDPAVLARNLIEISLVSESRDNHTAIVAHFANGADYVSAKLPGKEVIPGKFHNDDGFKPVYESDLKRLGVSEEEIIKITTDSNYANKPSCVEQINIKPSAGGASSNGFPPELMSQFINLLQSGGNEDN